MAGDPRWQPDEVLGEGFESTVLETAAIAAAGGHLGVGPRIATLIRYLPSSDAASSPGSSAPGSSLLAQATGASLLFLHGWSDYFFNTDLAKFFSGLGIAFYALDMHNHGRSLRSGDLGGFVSDLRDYDPELRLALAAVTADMESRAAADPRADGTAGEIPGPVGSAAHPRIALMGHSTGGLVAALWASRFPGTVSHLILNSPWLELHGGPLARHALYAMVAPFAGRWPEQRLRLPERNFYWRSISSDAGGEWNLDKDMRPPKAFPIRVGWMHAILAGHAQVAKGLRIDVPVLVLMSAHSMNGPFWNERMYSADVVLDTRTMAARTLGLGTSVCLEKIDGALHDVLLSRQPVRDLAYGRLRRWVQGYMLAPEGPGDRLRANGDANGDAR